MPTLDKLPNMADLTGSSYRFNQWLVNFNANAISIGGASFPAGAAAPAATGLVLIAGILSAWSAAYALATNLLTRIPANITALKVLRFGPAGAIPAIVALNPAAPGVGKGLVGMLRSIIRNVQGLGLLAPGQLEQLGLTKHTKVRSVPLIPHAGPELYVERSAPHIMTVKYKWEMAGGERTEKKPPGCKGVLIHWQTANGNSGAQVFTKNPAYLDVGEQNTGQRIKLTAWWQMGNNKTSPPGASIFAGVP
jgi:hypothetical protein